MARTDAGQVQKIISVRPGKDLSGHIDWATLIVDDVVTCAAGRGVTLSAAKLLRMETLLAAHSYSVQDAQYISKSTNGASGSFDVKQWFHQAIALDSTGCLAAILGKDGKGRNTAGGFWLGRAPSAQTDYVDRD